MRSRAYVPLLLLLPACLSSPGTGRDDPDLLARLRSDAVLLATDLIGRSEAPASELPVSPPPPLIDSIFGGLVAISELEHPARDSVFVMYVIRPRVEDVHSVVVNVDSLAPWADVWARGDAATGVLGVDSILQPLEVHSVEERQEALYGDREFVLQFRKPAHWWVLRERLLRVSEIEDTHLWMLLIGGGNHLSVERSSRRWRFRFTVGWGDCPSGCVNGHEWLFEVDDANGARFVGSAGDPLPPDISRQR